MAYSSTELSDRERQILQLASEGYTNDEIADRLGYSSRSIAKAFERIYQALGVRQARQEAIWRYMQEGRYATQR